MSLPSILPCEDSCAGVLVHCLQAGPQLQPHTEAMTVLCLALVLPGTSCGARQEQQSLALAHGGLASPVTWSVEHLGPWPGSLQTSLMGVGGGERQLGLPCCGC